MKKIFLFKLIGISVIFFCCNFCYSQIYWNSTDGGAHIFNISGSVTMNNVGIGGDNGGGQMLYLNSNMTTPIAVNNNTFSYNNFMFTDLGGLNMLQVSGGPSGYFNFLGHDGSPKMTINNSGSVQINGSLTATNYGDLISFRSTTNPYQLRVDLNNDNLTGIEYNPQSNMITQPFNKKNSANNINSIYYGMGLRINDNGSSIGFYIRDVSTNSIRLAINRGWVGIGTTTYDANYLLSVNGGIHSKLVKVESNWSDFVFRKDYKLLSLSELEKYIKDYEHLPDIPSEKEIKENGVDLGNMSAKLIQKVEELTLYVIDLNKQVEKLKSENARLIKDNKK